MMNKNRCVPSVSKSTNPNIETPLVLAEPMALAAAGDNRSVMEFYERFPCGGVETEDDERWVRLPWLQRAFEPDGHEGKRVLDLGCGIGIDAEKFVEGGAMLVGVDFALKPLRIASARLKNHGVQGNWHLVRADLRALPFKSGAFDYVYSDGVLHHILGYETAIQEAHRCLKNGGRGTALLYHKWSLMTVLTVLVRQVPWRNQIESGILRALGFRQSKATEAGLAEVLRHPVIQYFTRSLVREKLREAGFVTASVDAYDWLYPLLRRMSNTLPGAIEQRLGRFLVAKFRKESAIANQAGKNHSRATS